MRGAFPHARETVINVFVPNVHEGGVSARTRERPARPSTTLYILFILFNLTITVFRMCFNVLI